jgi:hypothetical protein
MKTYNEQQLAAIAELQQKHNLTRKVAIKRFEQSMKEAAAKASEPSSGAASSSSASATTKAPKAEVVRLTAEQVSANRKEGLRLFALSGRPTKDQFIAVYGKEGHKWTWIQRAKHLNLSSPEEAAKTFQATLAKVAPQLVKVAAPAPAPKAAPVMAPQVISKPNAPVAAGKAAVAADPTSRKGSRKGVATARA